jgi:hypothetical protein
MCNMRWLAKFLCASSNLGSKPTKLQPKIYGLIPGFGKVKKHWYASKQTAPNFEGELLELISTDLIIRKSISHALIRGVFLYYHNMGVGLRCTVPISSTGTKVRREPQQPENGSDPRHTATVGTLHSHLYTAEDLGRTPSPAPPPDRVQLQILRYRPSSP